MTDSSSSRHVNTILHNLRGEHYRHQQNVQQKALRTTKESAKNPSFPFGLQDLDPTPLAATGGAHKTWSGPAPPKSWQMKHAGQHANDDAVLRARMLSVMFSHLPSVVGKPERPVPSLAFLCAKIIISLHYSSKDELDEVLAMIPSHLRGQLLRDSALEGPLSNDKLYALCGSEGHADGELIVLGPTQSLHGDYFRCLQSKDRTDGKSWEEMDEWTSQSFHTFILSSNPLPPSTMLTLPATLTHLGLIDIQTSLPVHRLPAVCPLLVVLDLSYNKWLHETSPEAARILERVPWARWRSLEVLGLRECLVNEALRAKVNHGRWDDVQIIQ